MNWTLFDYTVMGGLLTVAATIILLLGRAHRGASYRLAVIVATTGAFLLVWVNGAVGIIGNENNDANLLFFAVLGVAAVGALLARFRPAGMSKTFYATAGAQVGVAVHAFVLGLGSSDPSWPIDILVATVFFSLFWVAAAALFRKAARSRRRLFLE